MPETRVISALIEKRTRVSGELETAKYKVVETRIKLLHIDSCLRMLKDDYEPKSIRPKKTTGKNPAGLRKGEGARTALDILRETGEARSGEAWEGNQPKAIHMLGVTLQSTFLRHRTELVGLTAAPIRGSGLLKAASPLRLFPAEEEWEERARRYLKAELKRADVKYAELAERLKAHSFTETEASVTNKLKRGKFPATFLLASMAAIGVAAVARDDL